MRYIFYSTPDADLRHVSPGMPAKKIWVPNDACATTTIRSVLALAPDRPDEIWIEDTLSFPNERPHDLRTEARSFHASAQARSVPSVAFFVDSDTIARTFIPVIHRMRETTRCTVYAAATKREGAGRALARAHIDYRTFSLRHLLRHRPDVLVFANDWSTEAKLLLALHRRLGIETACLQESVVHFGDPLMRRMERADAVFLQGAYTTKLLVRENTFITGNPRYESLHFLPLPARPRAFINCNFTYGVYEAWREAWLQSAVDALERRGIDYVISQHPRDTGDLSSFRNVVRSNAEIVHPLLETCSFVVSRFSSILHEALCLGRKVIYHNPHMESLNYDFGFDDQVLFLSRSDAELAAHIDAVTETPAGRDVFERYVLLHCKNPAQEPSALVADLLFRACFRSSDALRPRPMIALMKYLWRRTVT